MRRLTFVCFSLLTTSTIFAQAAARRACCIVSGTVADPAGLPAPEVEVRLVGNITATQTTNPVGEFRFTNIPAGDYLLTVTRSGFTPAEKKIRLRSNVTNVRIGLALEQQSAAVTVTDTAPVVGLRPEENRTAVEMDRDLLDALPTLGGDFSALAAQLVDPSIAGSAPTLVVNGVETDDIGVTASAISEVRINKNPFSAEYSRPGSARIEVITKQGTPEYHGDLNVYLRDYRLDARNAFALERPQQSRRTYEGNLSGGLGGSGKTTFLLSAEREEDNEQAVVYAQTPDTLIIENVPQPERENELSFGVNRHHSGRFSHGATAMSARPRAVRASVT